MSFLLSALSLRRRGFYTPYNYLKHVDWEVPPYPVIADLFSRHVPAFTAFLDAIAANADHLVQLDADPGPPHCDTVFLSRLDAAVLYTAMTRFCPAQVVEIGSGNSTHFMVRAVRDHALDCRITCLDPAPRRDIAALPVDFQRRLLAVEDVAWLADLAPGDVLFIDSSHFLQQGFDVDILFNRVFPVLAPGVIVHVHDVFLPYGYPPIWEGERFNEQLGLIGWLVGGCFEPLFASHYVWRDMRPALQGLCPGFPLDTVWNGGALWLRRT